MCCLRDSEGFAHRWGRKDTRARTRMRVRAYTCACACALPVGVSERVHQSGHLMRTQATTGIWGTPCAGSTPHPCKFSIAVANENQQGGLGGNRAERANRYAFANLWLNTLSWPDAT